MATGQGSAILDFGTAPGSSEASIAVTGLSTISSTSKAEAFIMGDDTTTDHTSLDHRYLPAFIGLTCGTPIAGTGFTIYARSIDQLQGTFAVRYVWAD